MYHHFLLVEVREAQATLGNLIRCLLCSTFETLLNYANINVGSDVIVFLLMCALLHTLLAL